jgi:chemotaxis protein MotB
LGEKWVVVMQRSDNVRPIIIKRKKIVAGGGHHGGAWKVAYADFVTAMMAFFLMLWLLGSVTEDQRKGIADYFSPTFSIQSQSSGSDSILGGQALSVVQSVTDQIATKDQFDAESRILEEVAKALTALSGQSMIQELALQHINIRLTDLGLLVEIFDLPDAPLFQPLSADPQPVLRSIVQMVAQAFGLVQNQVAIVVHSASFPSVILENPVWPLTVSRASSMRELLERAAMEPARIARLTGHADRKHAVSNPMDVRNNRIEIILLRNASGAQEN